MQILSTSYASLETANLSLLSFSEEVQNNYKYIKGKLVLEGRQPDGDSVAFVADNIGHFRDVSRSYLLKPSSRDGSVQLRFEGIDAPELHYENVFQPSGKETRNYLLEKILGFSDIKYKEKDSPAHPAVSVTSSTPKEMPAFIATNALETHGRPIAYVFTQGDFIDGMTDSLHPSLLQDTLNYKMLASGRAYLLAYTSMPVAHYQVFRQAANEARSRKLGVWKNDATHDFVLSGPDAIAGEEAQLIYPKLFRRCVDFLKSGQTDLKEWLRSKESENDGVRITEFTTVSLSSLIRQVNDHIYFEADTNDIMFIEK